LPPKQKKQESKKTKKAKLEKKGNYPAFFEENIVCEANYFVFCPPLIFLFLIVCLRFPSLRSKLEKPFARPNKIKSSWAN